MKTGTISSRLPWRRGLDWHRLEGQRERTLLEAASLSAAWTSIRFTLLKCFVPGAGNPAVRGVEHGEGIWSTQQGPN